MSFNENEEEYVLSEFPFRELKDFLPGQLKNNVRINHVFFSFVLINQFCIMDVISFIYRLGN